MEKYEFKRKDGIVKQYDYISEFKEGFAAVRLNQKWGFIDEDGNEICPIKYEFPTLFCEGYAGVGVPKGKYILFGYIDTKGNEACEFVYRYVCDFQENGLAFVRGVRKWIVINKEFKQITKRCYDEIRNFRNGYAIVKLNGLYGFINENGDEVCKIKYQSMGSFTSDGLAPVTLPETARNTDSDRCYYVDTQGKEWFCYFWYDKIQPVN